MRVASAGGFVEWVTECLSYRLSLPVWAAFILLALSYAIVRFTPTGPTSPIGRARRRVDRAASTFLVNMGVLRPRDSDREHDDPAATTGSTDDQLDSLSDDGEHRKNK